MRQPITPPQEVRDEHALVAQTYAGFLVGHPVRAARYTTPLPGSVNIDKTRPWVEPNPMPDDCIFCQRLTDDEAVRRVAGFQAAIDKEVLGRKWSHFSRWAQEHGHTVATPSNAPANHPLWRAFIEEQQYVPRQTQSGVPRPHGWETKAASIVSLPLRIKRKMCIDWNHVYTRWMAAEGLSYDFDKREFYKTIEDLEQWNDFIGQ